MEDKTIIDLYWKRSEDAITETSRKYGGYCFCIANNILSSKEDSEESVNDTWLAAWNTIPPKRPDILSVFLGKSRDTYPWTDGEREPQQKEVEEKSR